MYGFDAVIGDRQFRDRQILLSVIGPKNPDRCISSNVEKSHQSKVIDQLV